MTSKVSADRPSAPVSVVVCTRNEEDVIGRCLGSVAWADELLVVDSGSTDRTRERAERAGARWIEQPWLGFSAQKNVAAGLATNDWVFSLDADEVVTSTLARSLEAALSGPVELADGFAVDRRGDFFGVLLPNGARRSKRNSLVRLYNRSRSQWDESMAVHEVVRCPGQVHLLHGVLIHWNDFTVDELFSLFNRYATTEAQDLHERGLRGSALAVVIRPLLRFGWHYLVRGEYRLGGRGLVHSAIKASSDLMRYAKLWERSLPATASPRSRRPSETEATTGEPNGSKAEAGNVL